MAKELKALPKQFRQVLMNARVVRAAGDEGEPVANTYEVAISSETPVERWYGVEILSHDADAVDLERLNNGAALLLDHNTGTQIGVVESARIDDDKVLRGVVRFSKSALGQEIEADVLDGIRRHISVGYQVREIKLTESDETGDVYTVMRWTPLEVSLVAVPADHTVGVGRGEGAGSEVPVNVQMGEHMRLNPKLNAAGEGSGAAAPAPAPTATVSVTDHEAGVRDAQERAARLSDLAAANGLGADVAADWTRRGLTEGQAAGEAINLRKTKGTPVVPPGVRTATDGMDLSGYSYLRAIRGKVAEAEGSGKLDGLEAEVHQELSKRMPDDYTGRGGVIVPMRTRALNTFTPAAGGETVFTQPGELIELLRARAMVLASGARLLTGLTGPVGFPKQTSAATMYWMAEDPGTGVSDSTPAFGLATLAPKILMGNIPFTRSLLAQSSIDIEGWVREELATGHGLAIDKAAIHGKGSSGEPTGIYAASGVSSKDYSGTKPTLTTLMTMVTNISDANADLGTLGWLTTPIMAGAMRTTEEFSSTGVTIWRGNLREGEMLGYTARSTTQVSKTMSGSAETGGSYHGIIYGNWADIYVGLFGAMELVVDPYSNKKKAVIEVTSYQPSDVLLRHGASMSKGLNAPSA